MAADLRTPHALRDARLHEALVADGNNRISWGSPFRRRRGRTMTAVQLAMAGSMPYTAVRDAVITHPTLMEGSVVLFSSKPSSVPPDLRVKHRRDHPGYDLREQRLADIARVAGGAEQLEITVGFTPTTTATSASPARCCQGRRERSFSTGEANHRAHPAPGTAFARARRQPPPGLPRCEQPALRTMDPGHLPTARRPTRLDYQHEIGLRHTSAKKNRTDGALRRRSCRSATCSVSSRCERHHPSVSGTRGHRPRTTSKGCTAPGAARSSSRLALWASAYAGSELVSLPASAHRVLRSGAELGPASARLSCGGGSGKRVRPRHRR